MTYIDKHERFRARDSALHHALNWARIDKTWSTALDVIATARSFESYLSGRDVDAIVSALDTMKLTAEQITGKPLAFDLPSEGGDAPDIKKQMPGPEDEAPEKETTSPFNPPPRKDATPPAQPLPSLQDEDYDLSKARRLLYNKDGTPKRLPPGSLDELEALLPNVPITLLSGGRVMIGTQAFAIGSR